MDIIYFEFKLKSHSLWGLIWEHIFHLCYLGTVIANMVWCFVWCILRWWCTQASVSRRSRGSLEVGIFYLFALWFNMVCINKGKLFVTLLFTFSCASSFLIFKTNCDGLFSSLRIPSSSKHPISPLIILKILFTCIYAFLTPIYYLPLFSF